MSIGTIKRVIISGGGTGGHIFPALSIADTLRKRYPNVEILFIGAEGRMEMTRVPAAGYSIKGLPVEGLKRKQIWKNFGVLKNFFVSLVMARDIIRQFQPDVVVGVGGYASAPTLKAAQSLGVPTLIQEQNSYAGVTNKFLSRRADRICVAYPAMEGFFPKDKIVLTGNPIRPQIEFPQHFDRMDLAYGLADVVISRAGAGSISEICLLGKPSVLVPSPNVAEDHQTKNALALSSRGAAILIADRDARRVLTPRTIELVKDEPMCDSLHSEALKLAQGRAAEKIADELEKLIR